MIGRIALTLVLLVVLVLVLANFGLHTAIGIFLLLLIVIAIFFAVSGELIIERLPTVKRINSLQNSWGDYNLAPNKLVALRQRWDDEQAQGASLEPTRIKNFCIIQLEKLIEIVGTLHNPDRSRPISDIITVVSYPKSRLTHTTHELRLYAGLLTLVFLIQLLRKDPSILTKLLSADFLEGCRLLGESPIDFIAGLEVTIFAIFATRLLGEMSNLRQYTK